MDTLGNNNGNGNNSVLQDLSNPLDLDNNTIAIILAAGHGKRIKSETSKMLHKVWGVPSALRVANAAEQGLGSANQIIVVGVKAVDVAKACSAQAQRSFVYQASQNGTGHAVKMGLDILGDRAYPGTVYIFPGDIGLLSKSVVQEFRQAFGNNACDMMVLTSVFKGDPSENYYGRVLRVPQQDVHGNPAGDDCDKLIEILEHKDILALSDSTPYPIDFHGHSYAFSRQQLLEIREFNTGVFAFKSPALRAKINELRQDNVQGELYITDLISIFNQSNLTVRASATQDENAVLGFNVKSVLKHMEDIARDQVYEKLKDIITIVAKDDFFIADEVVEQILEMDAKEGPLDITIGKGASIGPNVKLSKGVVIGNQVQVERNVELGPNVRIHKNAVLSTYPHQTLRIGAGSEIFNGDQIKGNLEMGENCRIESGVNMTGSDQFKTVIGNNVLVKGTSQLFGCIVEDDIWIEHSVLKFQRVERRMRKDGYIQPIRWVLPQPQGLDSIHPLKSSPDIPERPPHEN
jgi:bifunctional UDP-N-acetylglucosamine pyrophosphorylase/glucosamine-1-phosphate N-acetyltransferase